MKEARSKRLHTMRGPGIAARPASLAGLLSLLGLSALLPACRHPEPDLLEPDRPFHVLLPNGFPAIPAPSDNPLTEASVACSDATSRSAAAGTPKMAPTSRISANTVSNVSGSGIDPASLQAAGETYVPMPRPASVARSPTPSAEKFDSHPA